MIELELIKRKLGKAIRDYKDSDEKLVATTTLALKVVKFVEREFGIFKGKRKKEYAMYVFGEIFEMVDAKTKMGWLYRWMPKWLVKRAYLWACSTAVDMAVENLNTKGIFPQGDAN